MYQKIIVIGHLARDPDVRYNPDSTAVANFNMAVDSAWKNSLGEKETKTTWFRVTAWRGLAEVCRDYLYKGMLVFVEGELSEPKPYQAKDGTWRASLDIMANTIRLLSSKKDDSDVGGSV